MTKRASNIRYLAYLKYFGFKVKCPCCGGRFNKFLPAGIKQRLNALCPACGSLERHRLLWIFLKQHTNFFTDDMKVLDIAPTPFLQSRWIRRKNLEYISLDVSSPEAMLYSDVTRLAIKQGSFDCFLCYHVLEHVPDDAAALHELYRILKPGGWAIIQSPVDYKREKTFEDPQASPEDRSRLFGQKDHVRIYGRDYKDRLGSAGFLVDVIEMKDIIEEKNITFYGLLKDEKIYYCRKN